MISEINKDQNRAFSRSEKYAAMLVSDREGDADHIQPYSQGGPTSIENCQILSASANKRKGAFLFKPRAWQSEFQKSWDEREENAEAYLLVAIPAGGKTWATLEVARKWISAGSDRRIIVVVPTDNLREQWSVEATSFGIDLQTKEFGINFKHGYQGGVTTYPTVANNPFLFKKLCSVSPTMVIFDEMHHCGDKAHYGRGVRDAFDLAVERLLLSGTPWKTDGSPIPYVKYDKDGFAKADFAYDYPRALSEEVVRNLVFDYSKGRVVNDLTGDEEILDKDIENDDAARRLRIILDADGDFVAGQIEIAHRKLIEYRKQIPDAAAMAICIDQSHAVRIAALIERSTGCKPSLIVSDGAIENDTVNKFRKSHKEWLVSVKKVSEGTDIKRLQVLCYLTNTTSELFFRQAIGRVSRVRDMDDYEAFVCLPADPRLIACAKNIESAQRQSLIDKNEEDEGKLREEGEIGLSDDAQSYSTLHEGTDLILLGGTQVTVEVYKQYERIAEATNTHITKVMEILLLGTNAINNPVLKEPVMSVMTKEEEDNDLRNKCAKKAYALSRLLDIDVSKVHRMFKPFKKHKDMTTAELRHKLAYLIHKITEEGQRGRS